MAAIVTGGEDHDSPQLGHVKKQVYEVTDLYPFMQYKVYKVKPSDGNDIHKFCQDHSLDEAVFVNLNGGKEAAKLIANEPVVVPHYFVTKDNCDELDVEYLRRFSLEKRLMYDPYLPIFYVYYATMHGDILGYLMMTDCELIFTPLNDKFKGTYTYEFGNINQNEKAGFTLSFEDIVGEPYKISIPSEHSDDCSEDITYDLKISLRQTGN